MTGPYHPYPNIRLVPMNHIGFRDKNSVNFLRFKNQGASVIKKELAAREWSHPQLQKYNRYNIKLAYVAMMPQYPKVKWKRLVFLKGHVPRHQFNLWLALHNKLTTIDRLLKQGIRCLQTVFSAKHRLWKQMIISFFIVRLLNKSEKPYSDGWGSIDRLKVGEWRSNGY